MVKDVGDEGRHTFFTFQTIALDAFEAFGVRFLAEHLLFEWHHRYK